jgi:phosphoenolpyruvate carboxylase
MKTKQVKLAIVSIATGLNRNGKITIRTAASQYNESGIFQLTEAHLDNIADAAMRVDSETLGDAIAIGNQNFEESVLVVTFRYCKAGEAIGLDKDGNPIVSADGSEVFTKDHWRTESFDTLELAESAADFIKDLLRDVAKDRLAAKRNGKRSVKPAARIERKAAPVVNDEAAELEPVDENVDDLFGDKPE